MTFTRLTLGEPRLRGRVKGEVVSGCTEPFVEGALLVSTDAHVSSIGGGLHGNNDLPTWWQGDFPDYEHRGWYWPDENGQFDLGTPPFSGTRIADPFFAHFLTEVEGPPWRYTNTDPFVGTHHFTRPLGPVSFGLARSGRIYINRQMACEPIHEDLEVLWGAGRSVPYAAILSPGVLVTLSGAVKLSSLGGNPRVQGRFTTLEETVSPTVAVTSTAWQTFEVSFVPQTTRYLVTSAVEAQDSSSGATAFFDNLQLTITT